MKKYNIFNIFTSINYVLSSIVIFGIFSLGLFVAPIVFSKIQPRYLASEVMTEIFFRYFTISFYLLIITLIIEVFRFIILKKYIRLKIYIFSILFLITTFNMLSYSYLVIAPKINEIRINNTKESLWGNSEFVSLHLLSEKLGKIFFSTGIIYMILSIFSLKKID